jgi:hypothetical protein
MAYTHRYEPLLGWLIASGATTSLQLLAREGSETLSDSGKLHTVIMGGCAVKTRPKHSAHRLTLPSPHSSLLLHKHFYDASLNNSQYDIKQPLMAMMSEEYTNTIFTINSV